MPLWKHCTHNSSINEKSHANITKTMLTWIIYFKLDILSIYRPESVVWAHYIQGHLSSTDYFDKIYQIFFILALNWWACRIGLTTDWLWAETGKRQDNEGMNQKMMRTRTLSTCINVLLSLNMTIIHRYLTCYLCTM